MSFGSFRGLFRPPGARARPSRPLRDLAWRSWGFPRPSSAALRAGRAIPLPHDRPSLRHSPTHFASGQKSMDAIAFGSSLGREKHMSRNTAKTRKTTAARVDVYEEVTNQIVALLEAGTRPWSPRWASGAASLPLRHEGTAYRGINILLLWSAAMAHGYTNPHWMTYRQAHELGGQVRKGEKGNLVVHAGTFTPKDGETGEPITDSEGEETSRAYLKRYVVFNVEQIDGLDMSKFPAPLVEIKNRDQRDPELDAAFARYPVPYREGGNSAYYYPVADSIAMPAFGDFVSGNAFYATLAHEAIHSTGHTSRLNRETLYDYGKSREIRAAEELIAEIGAAMLCAQLGMEPTEREDHAAYLASWLTALRNDKRAIFRAATAAQAGSELILSHMAAPAMSRAA
jgi:antirestriction protein ArdC